MNRPGQSYGQVRRSRVCKALNQEVPPLKTAGETEYHPNTPHDIGSTASNKFLLDSNIPENSTPYESILNEQIYSETPSVLLGLGNVPGYLAPGPHTAPKSTVSNSNTLNPTPAGTYREHGRRGATCGSKRGRETTGTSGSQQGPAQKRPRKSRPPSAVPSNYGRDAGGGGDEDEDEEDEDEEDEESDEDEPPTHPGPKEQQAFLCPMPSCKGKEKLWDNWNNLIQHLQNTHIKGFSFCERGCGRRFGLSSQYTRHVFKHKKKCKPLNGLPQRIPSLALDLNHAVGKVKGQNYEKLRQVIAEHKFYDLEDPHHTTRYVDPFIHTTSSQNPHQYNPQGQLPDWAHQIMELLIGHQRVCLAYHQIDPPSSGPAQAGNRLNHPPSSFGNPQAPQNPLGSAIQSRFNQPVIHPPGVYSTQPSATTGYHLGLQNGPCPSPHDHLAQLYQGTQDGGFSLLGNYHPLVGGDHASEYPDHAGSFIGNSTRANRGASSSGLEYGLSVPTNEHHFGPGAAYGNETGHAARFNRES